MRRFDVVAVLLLLAGGVLVPVLGWLAGGAMLLVSRRWRWWEKLLGLLVWPGGLIVPVLMAVSARPRGCSFLVRSMGTLPPTPPTPPTPEGTTTFVDVECHQPGPLWNGFPLVAIPLVLGPLVVAGYLLWRARGPALASGGGGLAE